MSDTADLWNAVKADRKKDGERRRAQASADWRYTAQIAADYGFKLIRHSEDHYQLIRGNGILNIYPGNHRLYGDKQRRPPYLKFPWALEGEWTLLDVLNAAIEAMGDGKWPR